MELDDNIIKKDFALDKEVQERLDYFLQRKQGFKQNETEAINWLLVQALNHSETKKELLERIIKRIHSGESIRKIAATVLSEHNLVKTFNFVDSHTIEFCLHDEDYFRASDEGLERSEFGGWRAYPPNVDGDF